jgi:hypothetical protein
MPRFLTSLCVLLVCICPALAKPASKLLHVQIVTRHGTRVPDATFATRSCLKSLVGGTEDADVAHGSDFVNLFGASPGALTLRGVDEMRRVGQFLKRRYFEDLEFIKEDYSSSARDFEFIAREGARQQRSAMALAMGMFPLDAVPITVVMRELDTVLSAPPLECSHATSNMIARWHAQFGANFLQTRLRKAVLPAERACNLSLRRDPVETEAFSPNPHAWITDVSDFMDTLAMQQRFMLSKSELAALTLLSFDMEQRSHFPRSDPRGAVMFAGDFPARLLGAFDSVLANGGVRCVNPPAHSTNARRPSPKSLAKMVIHTCSRDLLYALTYMFELVPRVPGQPPGRLTPASTLMFELYDNSSVRVLFFHHSLGAPNELLGATPVEFLRDSINARIAASRGDWRQLCVRAAPPIPTLDDNALELGYAARPSRLAIFLFSLACFCVFSLLCQRASICQIVSRAGYEPL